MLTINQWYNEQNPYELYKGIFTQIQKNEFSKCKMFKTSIYKYQNLSNVQVSTPSDHLSCWKVEKSISKISKKIGYLKLIFPKIKTEMKKTILKYLQFNFQVALTARSAKSMLNFQDLERLLRFLWIFWKNVPIFHYLMLIG